MKKGFTLIEMLGVIAILAIILLLTFPILTQTLKQTKENKLYLKDLKASTETYIELNRKKYPELDSEGVATITIQDLYDYKLLKGQYENLNNTDRINIIKKEDGTLEYYFSNTNISNQNFNYTGGEQTYPITQDGYYKLEVWGAQGGNSINDFGTNRGGYGGYSVGKIFLKKDTSIYVNVGGTSSTVDSKTGSAGGYNGGGAGGNATTDSSYAERQYRGGAGGGGATHIASSSGLLSTFSSKTNDIIIVAGGGGGATSHWNEGMIGGDAGGYSGKSGQNCSNPSRNSACTSFTSNNSGGTQSSGYAIGLGQDGLAQANSGDWDQSGRGGAGGGYYGGNASQSTTRGAAAGGGGSGYIGNTNLINKFMYCYGCEESNDESTKTISTKGTSTLRNTTNCPNGYSDNPISKCAKAENGYAKITYLGIKL